MPQEMPPLPFMMGERRHCRYRHQNGTGPLVSGNSGGRNSEEYMAQNITKGIRSLLDEANLVVENMSVEEASKCFDSEAHVFVDLRDIRELQREGKILGAFSCPRGMLEFWIDPESPYHKDVFNQDKTYVFYCASAWRSALAAKQAGEMGLSPVMHMTGGFSAWKTFGAPVERN